MDVKVLAELADLDFARMFDHLTFGPSPYVWPMYEAFVSALTEAGIADAAKRGSFRHSDPHLSLDAKGKQYITQSRGDLTKSSGVLFV